MSQIAAELTLRAKIAFPSGELIVTDRADVGGEVRVLDWGEVDITIDGGEDHVELRLSNVPINGVRLSDRWSLTQPPEGAKVTIEWSHHAMTSTPNWVAFFVGSITEVSMLTELEVVLQVGDVLAAYERDIGDPITVSEFAQAAEDAIGRAKPVVLGTVKQWTPPISRERKKTTTKAVIDTTTATPFTLSVESSKGWPNSGSLKIDDELFVWDNTGFSLTDQLRIVSRAQSGTTAGFHDIGALVVEQVPQTWLVADHPSAAITQVYAVSSSGTKIQLDASKYTAYLGTGVDYRTTITTTATDAEEIELPSDRQVYRRVDLDAADTLANPGFPSGFGTPTAAKNPALACGDAGQWAPDAFATLYHKSADTLAVRRSAAFDPPAVPFDRAYLCVEHFGLRDFGKSARLITEITETATTFATNKTAIFFAGQKIRCDAEEMLVFSLDVNAGTITVTRAIDGTTAAKHPADARVIVIVAALSQGGASVFPIVRLWLEDSVGSGTYSEIGKLIDFSQIPPDTKDESEVVTASMLSAFHGHPVDDSVFSSGLFPPSVYATAENQWQEIGSLAVATILTTATEDSKIQEPLSPQVVRPYRLDSTKNKVRFTLNGANTSLNTSHLQKIQALRVRVVHAATGNTGGVPASTIRIRWVIGENIPIIVLDEFDTNDGALIKTKGPKVSTFGVPNIPTKFPNGLLAISLFSHNSTIIVERTTNDTDLYHVAVDCILEQQQLIGNSAELVADRSIVSGRFDCVLAKDGSYDSLTAGVKSDIILELVASNSHYYFLSDNAATFKVLGPGGSQSGLVMFCNDATNANETKKFNCYWTGIDAPSDTRVLSVSVFMDFGVKATTGGTSITAEMVNESNSQAIAPSSASAGVLSNLATQGDTFTRLTYWWTFTNLPSTLTVGQLLQYFRVRFTSNSAKATGNEAYINAISYRVELGQATGKVSKTITADQFTRVQYFDLTESLSDYTDILNRRTLVQFQKNSIGNFESAKPLLLHRVFWLFRHFEVNKEPLDRIAVDMTGIALTDSVDAFRKVLTYGYPLLNLPTANIGEPTFALAAALGALPIAGVVEEPTPCRELLAKMAEQAKCSLFFASGTALAPLDSVAILSFKLPLSSIPGPNVGYFWSGGDMYPDTLEIQYRTKDSVGNFITVKGDKNYATGEYRISSEKKLDASIAKYRRRPFELNADFLASQTLINSLSTQLLEYRHEREIIVRFRSPPTIKALGALPSLIAQISHPIFSSSRTEIIGIRLVPGSLSGGLPPYVELSVALRPAAITPEANSAPDLGGDGT